MQKNFIIILFLAIGTLQKPLNYLESKADFFEKIKKTITDLELKSTINNQNTLSLQYYFTNKSTSRTIHAIDINYSITPQQKSPILIFTQAKRTDIKKYITSYYKEEMDMQWIVLYEIVNRMLIAPDLGKKDDRLYLNLLSDVRERIKDNYKERNFQVEVSFVDGNLVRIELVSEESLISFFNVRVVEGVMENSKSQHYEEKNFFMEIDMYLSQHNLQEKKNLKIDMITENKNHFESKIGEILGHLDLDKFINNNQENVNQLSKYFKKCDYVLSNVVPKDKVHLDFQINYETQKALGRISYTPPTDLDSLGNYTLRILKDGDEIKNFSYKRMANKEFHKLLDKNEMDKLFKSMFDEIMEMFKTKYEETHSKLYKDYKLSEYTKEATMFGYEQKGLLAKNNKGDVIIEFLYSEDKNNNLVLSFKGKDPLLELTQHFPKMMYNKQVVSRWVENCLEHHVVMKKQNITFI